MCAILRYDRYRARARSPVLATGLILCIVGSALAFSTLDTEGRLHREILLPCVLPPIPSRSAAVFRPRFHFSACAPIPASFYQMRDHSS
jgi:hypothetical protein